MTTRVTVAANHGWPVRVTTIAKDGAQGTSTEVSANATQDFYVWDGQDLLIHEIQPSEQDTDQ